MSTPDAVAPSLEKDACAQHALVPGPGEIQNIALLQPNFQLNLPPNNYLRRRSLVEELIFRAAASEFQKKSPCASINLLSEFMDSFDSLDAVVGIKSIKSMIRSLFSQDQALSLVVRQLDGVLLIDEFDIDALLLRLRVDSRWNWLLSFIREREMILCRCHPEEEKQRLLNDLYEKFLYHTVNNTQACLLPDKAAEMESANSQSKALTLVECKKPGALATAAIETQQGVTSSALLPASSQSTQKALTYSADSFLRWGIYDFGGEEDDRESTKSSTHESASTTSTTSSEKSREENASTENSPFTSGNTASGSSTSWRCLVGSDMAVFGTPQHPRVSLNLQPQHECISVLRGIDLWLENEIYRVPEIGMCFHMDGVVTSDYSIQRTDELPHNMGFQPEDVREAVRHFLEFMRDKCTKPGHSYWLVKEKESDMLKMFDLTELFSKVCGAEKDNGVETQHPDKETTTKPSSADSSCSAIFLQPVCLLCIRRAESLLEKYRQRCESSGLPTSFQHHPSQHPIGGERYLQKAAAALHTCLRLLDIMDEEGPMRKEISSRALKLLIRVYHLGPTIVVSRLCDDFMNDYRKHELGLKTATSITLYSVMLPIQEVVPASTVTRIQEQLSNDRGSHNGNYPPGTTNSVQTLAQHRHSFACVVPTPRSSAESVQSQSTPSAVSNTQIQPLAPNSIYTLVRMLQYTPVEERRKVYSLICTTFHSQMQADAHILAANSDISVLEHFHVLKRMLLCCFLNAHVEHSSVHDQVAILLRIIHAVDQVAHSIQTPFSASNVSVEDELRPTELEHDLLFSLTPSSSSPQHLSANVIWGLLLRLGHVMRSQDSDTFLETAHLFAFELVELCVACLVRPSGGKSSAQSSTGLFSTMFSRCDSTHHHAWGVIFTVLMNAAPHIQLAITKQDEEDNANTSDDDMATATSHEGFPPARTFLSRYLSVCRHLPLQDRQAWPQYALYTCLNELGLLYLRCLTETRVQLFLDMIRHKMKAVREAFLLSVAPAQLAEVRPRLLKHALTAATEVCERTREYQLSEKQRRESFIVVMQTVELIIPHLMEGSESQCNLLSELASLLMKVWNLPSAMPLSEELRVWQNVCLVLMKSASVCEWSTCSVVYCVAFMRTFVLHSGQTALSVSGILEALKHVSTLHCILPHLQDSLESLQLAPGAFVPLMEEFRRSLFKSCVKLEAKKQMLTSANEGHRKNAKARKSSLGSGSLDNRQLATIVGRITAAFKPDPDSQSGTDAQALRVENVAQFCISLHEILHRDF